jgi:similar to stage IV sporulation protein
MEWTQLWAGVTFAAQNGDAEGLLTAAAAGGLHLSDIVPRPGGFSARCAAWHYRKLAALARRRRVRLRIQKRQGLFFCIRPLLRRRGLWAGCLVFLPLLLWLQGFIWFVEPAGLTPGQQARAAVVLWEAGLFPGNAVTQEKLAAGEYALLQSGEFSWASLNFMKGKLVAEAAAAKPVPDIAAGTLHGLRARVSGTVVRTNLVSGTMLVVPGQAVEAGQGLIGTARAERDGTLIFQPAAGSVRAQFEWEFAEELPLTAATYQLTGNTVVQRRLFLAGRVFPLPSLFSPADDSTAVTRHLQPELLGLMFPLSVEETTYYEQAENEIHSSEDEASALARLHGLQALQNDYPDAEFVAQKVDVTTENDTLHYRIVYTIIADICT